MALVLASGAFVSFFTFATPLLIHSVSKKYVTRLYYNQVDDKYTAVVYSFFVKPKKIEFKLSDVDVPSVPGIFTTFKVDCLRCFLSNCPTMFTSRPEMFPFSWKEASSTNMFTSAK